MMWTMKIVEGKSILRYRSGNDCIYISRVLKR